MTPDPAKPLRVGDVVHGFLGGAFGRDHYDCARIEAMGADWVVIRTLDGQPRTATGRGIVRFIEEESRGGSRYPHSSGCMEGDDDYF